MSAFRLIIPPLRKSKNEVKMKFGLKPPYYAQASAAPKTKMRNNGSSDLK